MVLSIVSLQLAVSKIFSSDFKVCFHILQSAFWLIWILSYLTLLLAFQILHLDIKINVFNRNSCLPPILNPNIIFFSFKLTVPTFKVFIKIEMLESWYELVSYTAFKKQMLEIFLHIRFFTKDSLDGLIFLSLLSV